MSERLELTPELRKQFTGYLPFSNDATTEYTPDFYLKKERVWDEDKKNLKTPINTLYQTAIVQFLNFVVLQKQSIQKFRKYYKTRGSIRIR